MTFEVRSQTAGPAPRARTVGVRVGPVTVGGGAPIVVQSMTNTDTADVDATVAQVAALAQAGSELVRITVDRNEAAAAVPRIRERLERLGVVVPLVGDFHYIGHKLLADYPACAEALAKYRINPGNVGFREKKDRQFGAIVETAIRYGKPVRIGEQEWIHDAHADNPTQAFQISRLDDGTMAHVPIGIFRQVDRPTYDDLARGQLASAAATEGDGDLSALIAGNDTWTVSEAG